jgi:hypothetical protein
MTVRDVRSGVEQRETEERAVLKIERPIEELILVSEKRQRVSKRR